MFSEGVSFGTSELSFGKQHYDSLINVLSACMRHQIDTYWNIVELFFEEKYPL